MNRDELNIKYPFLATLPDNSLDDLFSFIIMGMVEMSIAKKSDDARIMTFIREIASYRKASN